MQEPTIVCLDFFTLGYDMHTRADTIIQNATEPTIVEMRFSDGTMRRYSRQCATDASIEVGIEYLTDLLKTHDWYYYYSDDARAYRAGEAHWQKIQWAMQQLQARDVDVQPLYAQYRPAVA